MDAKTARTLNIRSLVKAAGGPAAWAAKHGNRWAPAQVSQWISETNPKGIGHALARQIDAACGKRSGWLDTDHSSHGTDDTYDGSQDLIYRPEIVAVAWSWVRFEEGAIDAKGRQPYAYPDDLTRAKRLLAICAMIEADGGILTAQHTQDLIDAATERHQQGKAKDGKSARSGGASTRRR